MITIPRQQVTLKMYKYYFSFYLPARKIKVPEGMTKEAFQLQCGIPDDENGDESIVKTKNSEKKIDEKIVENKSNEEEKKNEGKVNNDNTGDDKIDDKNIGKTGENDDEFKVDEKLKNEILKLRNGE